MKKKQYRYLDLLKAIAITFVCMYHFYRGPLQDGCGFAEILQKYVYPILSTCVPLFFAINGALLLNRESFDVNKHFRKLLFILMQYYIWHGITVVILGLSAGVDFSLMHKDQLMNLFLFLGTTNGVNLDHFWFISTLCGIYVLYPFLKTAFEQRSQNPSCGLSVISLLAVAYFLCFFIHDFSIFRNVFPCLMYLDLDPFLLFNPFGGRTGTMLTYFLVGGILHRYHQKTKNTPTAVCFMMILAGLLLLYGVMTVKTWQGEPNYDIVFEGYSTTGTLLCTVGIFLLISKAEEKLPSNSVPLFLIQRISRNTMTIYYTHWIMGYVLLPILPIGYGYGWNLLKAGLMVVCGTLLGEGMRRIPVLKYLIH